MQRMPQHQIVFVRHIGRQQAYFGSTTSTCINSIVLGISNNITHKADLSAGTHTADMAGEKRMALCSSFHVTGHCEPKIKGASSDSELLYDAAAAEHAVSDLSYYCKLRASDRTATLRHV